MSGKTGVGKSSLLNGIVGKQAFEEGEDFDPMTSEVKVHECEKAGVRVVIYDTPGLQDGSREEAKYLRSMKEKCKNAHLLLYCISMLETRSDLSCHDSAVKKISDELGPEVWENSIIVLTFANVFEDRLKDDGVKSIKKDMESKVKEWEGHMRSSLRASGVKEEVLKNVVAVLAGYGENPHLESQQYWLSNVWSTSLSRMKEEAYAAMVMISFSRFCKDEDVKPEDFKGDISKQPLVFTKLNKAAMTGTAIAGGVAGATTGALIGALVIGIPSFGVFAGLGLVLGGVLGGAAGVGEGIAVGMLIALYQKKKKIKKLKKIKETALEQMGKKLADQDQ